METIKLIEDYLDGTLNESERKQFEEKLMCDVEFNQLCELHKEVNESIRDTNFYQFHSLVKQVDTAYFNKPHEYPPVEHASGLAVKYKNLMRFAALLLVVFGIAAVLKFAFFYGAQPERLFDRYYEAYSADIVMRSALSEGNILENAVMDYNRGEYATALRKLNELTSENQKNHLAWFYKGLTCLALDQTSEAIGSFRMIDADWNHPLLEHRNWYLALALLHNNNREEAIVVFSEIREFNGYYAENASKIIRKLGS